MNFADRDGLIWMDGEMVPWRDAKVHVLTHSLHYGLACFEGVRANNLESCYIRPISFYGSEKMGVSPKGARWKSVV